jgi:hypothetical protein
MADMIRLAVERELQKREAETAKPKRKSLIPARAAGCGDR